MLSKYATVAWNVFTMIMIIALSFLCFYSINEEQQPAAPTITAQAMATYVSTQMPDSHLRSNLLVVFGTELNGDSQELNALLLKYAEVKIKQMDKGL